MSSPGIITGVAVTELDDAGTIAAGVEPGRSTVTRVMGRDFPPEEESAGLDRFSGRIALTCSFSACAGGVTEVVVVFEGVGVAGGMGERMTLGAGPRASMEGAEGVCGSGLFTVPVPDRGRICWITILPGFRFGFGMAEVMAELVGGNADVSLVGFNVSNGGLAGRFTATDGEGTAAGGGGAAAGGVSTGGVTTGTGSGTGTGAGPGLGNLPSTTSTASQAPVLPILALSESDNRPSRR